jgi:hypothetical protein
MLALFSRVRRHAKLAPRFLQLGLCRSKALLRLPGAAMTDRRSLLATISFVLVAGCTVIRVEPLAKADLPTPQVCIERNPAVLVKDFVDVMQGGFHRHGIEAEAYDAPLPESCEVVVTYTARQSWDLVRYLATAEIWMRRGGRQVAYAKYYLRGGGGYALTKYEGTAKKMKPLFDQLLKEHRQADAGIAAAE